MVDFPIALSNVADNTDDVMAKHVNNLEVKVGIDDSADTNSLDYLIKNSVDPGHTHTFDFDNVLPWRIDINAFTTPSATTGIYTLTTDEAGGSIYNAFLVGANAQNNLIAWDLVLAAGTWTVSLLHLTGSDRGIYSLQFDGVEKGTIDGYSAGTVRNVLADVTGISIATSGKVRFSMKVATKHASSSAYFTKFYVVSLIRTA